MSTLQTQYKNYIAEGIKNNSFKSNADILNYNEWLDQVWSPNNLLNTTEPPFVSDDFQIGPNGAFEWGDDVSDWDATLMDGLNDIDDAKSELIMLLENQIMDLVMMSKIELGDDVIEEIKRLKQVINGE